MRKVSRGILLLIAFAAVSIRAADNNSLWQEATEYYDQGNYKGAIAVYNKLLEKDFAGPEVYYNLGNSYFKAGDLGHAIWSYRRALLLNPGFSQARNNLEYVRTFNTDQIATRRRGFVLDIWDFASGILNANGYLLLLMAGWWTLAGIIIWSLLRFGRSSWQYYLLIVPLIIIIFSSASAARRISDDRLTRWGVLASESADIREGPGEEFSKVEIGHEGLEFKILGARENSYLIELENGLKGWVDKEAVLEI